MKNIFNTVKMNMPKSNMFDLTHDVKMSMQFGNLTPVLAMECIPGDKVTIGADSLIRMAPMIAPVMHRFDASIHYFAVPKRLLWDNWEKFIVNEGEYAFPKITVNASLTAGQKKFLDYMGVPPFPVSGGHELEINAMPFAAYQFIYNEYYRDQNLINEVDFKLSDGNNDVKRTTLLTQRLRSLEHDYFTASLPFAQKGSAVDIPIGVIENDVEVKANFSPVGTGLLGEDGVSIQTIIQEGATPNVESGRLYADIGGLELEPTTINDLRLAFRLQEWFERNARGGTRYIEHILAHFGVRSSDKRLQRPEYITGVKTPIIISEVLNTTGEDAGLPQGNMAGHGVGVTTGKLGSYYAEDHCYIIGIMSILPKTAYYQGVPKMYQKDDFLDFAFPTFAHIGEQAVKNSEIFAYSTNQNETFGYVPRYAEYKFMPSRVAGDFRGSLEYWHLDRKFASAPSLNQNFIECDPNDNVRIFATTDDDDKFYCHVLNKIKAVRKLPRFGTPTI